MRRVVVIMLGVGVAVAVACGGLVANGPPGTLDDAGVFYEPDGHVLFAPGSACKGYDEAHFIELTANAPSCSDPGSVAGGTLNESASCEAWVLDVGLSFGYIPYAECYGKCTYPSISQNDPALHCTWHSPGADAYCRAFFQQFAVSGIATGYCTTNGEADRGRCNTTCDPFELLDAGLVPIIGTQTDCVHVCQ